ncbi:OprD family outer membrane porin [Campylobacterota bacterium DY0563]
MKVVKLSLIAFVLGCSASAFAADSISDAFKNGSTSGNLKVWYWDKDIDNSGTKKSSNILNTAIELNYLSDTYYNFSAGVTFQANATPNASEDAKAMFINEEYASGSVLSEAFLDYNANQFDIKVGRQFINSFVINGNYARMLKESFEGSSLKTTLVPDTSIFGYYISKFQGRTSHVSGNGAGDAPTFRKKTVFGGAGPLSYEFDGAYSIGFTNKSIPNLKLDAAYLLANDVGNSTSTPTLKDDLSIYYLNASYRLPLDGYKLGLDVKYVDSSTGSKLDANNWEGDIFDFNLSAAFNGFLLEAAYSTTSDSDRVILGMGNGVKTYTLPMIRGPFVYSTQAGTDSYSYSVKYNFEKAGIKGLKGRLQYVTADRDDDRGIKRDYNGYGAALFYKIPQIKNLSANIIYFSLDEKVTDVDTDELWVKLNYKF